MASLLVLAYGIQHEEHEDPYAEIFVVYRRMTHGRYQHFAPPSKVTTESRLRFEEFVEFELEEAFAGYQIAMNILIFCKLSQKIESYAQGWHTSAKMRAIEGTIKRYPCDVPPRIQEANKLR
ncbi:hypothetical protein RB195_026282 [Necator americanus]|uniref:Uncharacterized protein n=1 Tax=Necator americanus TaxID=51031 RepID=A0ABR1EYL5_NECAM